MKYIPKIFSRLTSIDSLFRSETGIRGDIVLFASSTIFALYTALWSTLPSHRAWGKVAVIGYALGLILALWQSRQSQRSWKKCRITSTALACVGAVFLPLVLQIVARASGHSGRVLEEVRVIEHAAQALLHSGTPYLSAQELSPSRMGPDLALQYYFPYQPVMALMGLPRAIFHSATWTDARIMFVAVTVVITIAALKVSSSQRTFSLRAAQVLLCLPPASVTIVTGGDDLPVLALCLLSLALADRNRWSWAAVAVGAAVALKLIALPLLIILLVVVWVSSSKTTAIRFTAVGIAFPLLTLIPALLLSTSAVIENVVKFPLGLAKTPTPAASPGIGWLIAHSFNHGKMISVTLLACAALGLGIWLLVKTPASIKAAAIFTALSLTVAIVMAPATRFGYLLYPLALLAFSRCLNSPDLKQTSIGETKLSSISQQPETVSAATANLY